MTINDREGLLARIRQIRRTAAVRGRPGADPAGPEPTAELGEPQPDRVGALEARVRELEQLLEGLQDSVHRESARHERMIAELQAQVQPAAMNAALAEDARNRGL